jgi:LysR family transcriptional regulator, nod-box dependent transcriptional activator
LKKSLSSEAYFSLGHVTARFGKLRAPAFEDWFFRQQSEQRRVEVVAPSFGSLPGLVKGTERIAKIHRRLANRLASDKSLIVRELPFDMPPIQEIIQWHAINNNDTGLQWVVEQIASVAFNSDGFAPDQNDRRELSYAL